MSLGSYFFSQQGTRHEAVCSSNFLMWVWGVILFHSSKKSPVQLEKLICTGHFFEGWNEITPQSHIRKFEEQVAWKWMPWWETFLSVLWVSVSPVDVKNDSQQGTLPQAICSSNFLMWIWWVILFHSSKKSHVLETYATLLLPMMSTSRWHFLV